MGLLFISSCILGGVILWFLFFRKQPFHSVPTSAKELPTGHVAVDQLPPGAVCPLGFSNKPQEQPDLVPDVLFSLSQLHQHDGVQSETIYVVAKDVVYDVTSASSLYGPGGASHALAGRNLTTLLAKGVINGDLSASIGDESHYSLLQFSFDEIQRLEGAARMLSAAFPAVGRLQLHEEGKEEVQHRRPSLTNTSLHQAIEQGDMDIIRTLLDEGADVNELCSRTFMTPVHKAIESENLELLQLLLATGRADLQAKAMLYDDETPLQMAQRFQYQAAIELLKQQTQTVSSDHESKGSVTEADAKIPAEPPSPVTAKQTTQEHDQPVMSQDKLQEQGDEQDQREEEDEKVDGEEAQRADSPEWEMVDSESPVDNNDAESS